MDVEIVYRIFFSDLEMLKDFKDLLRKSGEKCQYLLMPIKNQYYIEIF